MYSGMTPYPTTGVLPSISNAFPKYSLANPILSSFEYASPISVLQIH